MGRTLPSATVVLMQEEAAFARFRRALRRSDQLALDDLFVAARQHIAAVQFASHALPFEVYLLSMLLEEHKEVMKIRDQFDLLAMNDPQAGLHEKAGDFPAGEDNPGSEDIFCGEVAPGEKDASRGKAQSGRDAPLDAVKIAQPQVEVWQGSQLGGRTAPGGNNAPRKAGCRAHFPFVDPGFGIDDAAGVDKKSLPD